MRHFILWGFGSALGWASRLRRLVPRVDGLALALAQLVRSPMKDFDYRLESVVRWPLDSNFDLRSSSFC